MKKHLFLLNEKLEGKALDLNHKIWLESRKIIKTLELDVVEIALMLSRKHFLSSEEIYLQLLFSPVIPKRRCNIKVENGSWNFYFNDMAHFMMQLLAWWSVLKKILLHLVFSKVTNFKEDSPHNLF